MTFLIFLFNGFRTSITRILLLKEESSIASNSEAVSVKLVIANEVKQSRIWSRKDIYL